ncbi:hypothetical protein BH10PLA1_BH10PLA1_21910 [soil metagenome]
MSGVSMPVNRPIGRALIVGSPSTRSQPLATLQRHGYTCAEADDPYAAMAELCRRPLVYRAVIFSLASVYKEELAMIATVKRRFPHVEMWLTNTDGRQALMIEAMRLGAEGLVAEDGLHRLAIGAAPHLPLDPADVPRTPMEPMVHAENDIGSPDVGEAVLTADELRALLQEQPASPRSDHD